MNIKRFRLDNDLTLLAEEMHEAPVVALQAWVHVGSADESEEIAGIAHVHEHMLFKGTSTRGVGEIARTVEASGGEINAWTSFDQTVYHVVLASSELDTGLDILADALRDSAFDSEELEREIEVVLEEIKRSEDNPSRRVANELFNQAYRVHPYRRPVIGYAETIRALSRERILAFFRERYRPDAVTLVAVGDFDSDELRRIVEERFGDWAASVPVASGQREPEPAQEAPRIRVLTEAVKEARIAAAWHIPAVDHDDIAAIDVLSVVLGHGESSRLYVETRRRRELVNDVYAYAYTPRDPGLFMVGAGLRTEKLESALASLLDETFRLRSDLVSQDELEKAKVIILSEAAYQRETVQGQARKLGFFEVVAGDYAFEQTYYERLRELTRENVREVARRYLHEKPALVVQVPETSNKMTETEVAQLVAERYSHAGNNRVQSRQQGALGVTRVVLNNGCVLLIRPEETPVVAVRALALGGLRYESAETQGLGHLFASLWGQSSDGLSVEAMANQVALLGGHISAFAGRNSIGLRGEFIREKGGAGTELFVDALLSRSFDSDDLERERAVILERIRNREDSPAVVAFDTFAKALFPSHPYGLRSIGTEATVTGFGQQHVLAYADWLAAPDKLVIAVSGEIDVDATIDLLASRLRGTPSAAHPEPPQRDLPPTSPRRSHYALDKQQAHIIIGAMGTTVADPDRHALEILTTVLSGQSGRLFLDLRDQQSLAYAISSSSLEGLDPGHVLVHVGTSPDKVSQALDGVYGHLERLREQDVGDGEIDRAKRYLIGTHAIDLQRGGARAMLMALGELFGLGYDQYVRYADDIQSVTAAQVRAAANKYLASSRLVEAIVGPER